MNTPTHHATPDARKSIRRIVTQPCVAPRPLVFHVAPTFRREQILRAGAILSPYEHNSGLTHWMSERTAVYFWPTLALARLWAEFMTTAPEQQDIWHGLRTAPAQPDTHYEIDGRGHKAEGRIVLPRLVETWVPCSR